MISKVHKYFHWIYNQKRQRHYYIIGSGVFIWLFLSITMPFGIYAHNFPSYAHLVLHLGSFALIFIMVLYSVDYLVDHSPFRHLKPKLKYDFAFWLVKIGVLVQAFHLLRSYLCEWRCIDVQEYLELWLACFLLFLFTYIPFALYGKYKYFQAIALPKEELFELKGSGKERISVDLNAVLYLQSDDNYVDVMLLNPKADDQLDKQTLRATLKSLVEQLNEHPQFQRIHRSYVVNMQFAKEMSNKKALTLAHKQCTVELPISKKYSARVFSLFEETNTHHK